MTSPRRQLATWTKTADWQQEAWRFFDAVGELRFGASWVGSALSRVNLVAAAPPSRPGDDPTPIYDDPDLFTPAQLRAAELVAQMAGGPLGQAQIMGSFGVHLTVAGVAYLVVEPDLSDPDSDEYATWRVYGSTEIRTPAGNPKHPNGVPVIEVAVDQSTWRQVHPNAAVIKCWRRHPTRGWEPDAPTRAALGVLAQIEMLASHVTATGQSRLAGAGLLLLPTEATFPPMNRNDGEPGSDDDSFIPTLIESMVTPIADRSSAAAVVPLVARVPGEYVDKAKHLTFSTEFDGQAIPLLEQAIRRLALAMDLPPEVLTGVAGVNHWTAWQVEETAITLHVEPPAEMVCHALNDGFLAPLLEAEKFDPGEAIVWYDTIDLSTRPDRGPAAATAYAAGVISDAAYVREIGLSADDLLDEDARREQILLTVARGAPTLAPLLLAELGYLDMKLALALTGIAVESEGGAAPENPLDAPESDATPRSLPDAPTDPPDAKTESETIRAAALAAAADQIVYRALERAGARLNTLAANADRSHRERAATVPHAAMHTIVDATALTDLDTLTASAWGRVPEVADRFGMSRQALVDTLAAYTRALLASGQEHTYERLASVLGPA